MASENQTHSKEHVAITGFVEEIAVVLVNMRIFYPNHPRVMASLTTMLGHLETLLEEAEDGSVKLAIIRGVFVFNGQPLLGGSTSSLRTVDLIQAWKSGGIEIDFNVKVDDLQGFVHILSQPPGADIDPHAANRQLDERGCRSIRFLSSFNVSDEEESLQGAGAGAMTAYQKLIEYLQDAAVRVEKGNESVDIEEARIRVEAILGLLAIDPIPIFQVARYEQFDPLGLCHAAQVCLLAANFARHTIKDEAKQISVTLAALLHDVGKFKVPQELLQKQGKYTEAERAEIEKHPLFGLEILTQSADVDVLTLAAAFGHHRGPDGKIGYPLIPGDKSFSGIAQLIRVIDVYEALTAPRPYKEKVTPVQAYQIMLAMEGGFSPAILQRFIAVNGLYPLGMQVKLNTGDIGRVIEQGTAPNQPQVVVEFDPTGAPVTQENAAVVDLAEKPEVRVISLATSLA